MGYAQEAEGANGRTAFRRAEKQYRLYREGDLSRRSRKGRKKPLQAEVDLSDVVDFDRVAAEGSDSSYAREQGVQKVEGEAGLPTYALCSHPGMKLLLGLTVHNLESTLLHCGSDWDRRLHSAFLSTISNTFCKQAFLSKLRSKRSSTAHPCSARCIFSVGKGPLSHRQLSVHDLYV
jgi:hypothetical protein